MKIYWLDQIPQDKLNIVGGKAKGLFQLNQAHFKVAKGFVATDVKTKENMKELVSFWKQSGLTNVAVRSSATLEDGIDFSSAGQYESFLNIDNENDFFDAVDKCLASLNQPIIQKYRSFFTQGQSDMNLIVQQMVDAKAAGVAFSMNPLNKASNVVIEAVEGLGEALVAGTKQATVYELSRKNPIYKQDGMLSEGEVKSLYHGAVSAEKTWGIPMDLEWAINQEGEVIWLQARPITTLNDPTLDELNTHYLVDQDVITNHNVGEMLPGAITPLTISTVVYAIDYGLREMLVKIGMYKDISKVPEELLISHYYGHLFFNMRYLYRISKAVFGAKKENVDIGICGKVLEPEQMDDYKEKGKVKKLINGIRYAKYMMSKNKARRRVAKVPNKIKFDESNIESLYTSITKNLKYLNKTLSYHYMTSSHSGAMSSAVYYILSEDIEDQDVVKAKLTSILEDIDDIESVDILRSLRKVARAMVSDNQEVVHMDAEALVAYMKEAPQTVKYNLDEFIRKHGHRSIRESELRNVGWKDDELGLMGYLQSILQTKGIEKEKESKTIDKTIDSILEPYKGLKRSALKYLIKEARNGCRNREFSKSRMVFVINQFKQAYRKLAEMLVEQGALPDTDLIYFLTHRELGDLIFHKNPLYVKKSGIRRRLLNEQEQLKFDHVYLGRPEPIDILKELKNMGSKLQGTPLSRGRVVGMARVIESIEDAKSLKPGEIMVAGYTDIGWSPYYAVIGGLVTEVGSALSHGAVVAREYALPTVSNIEFATRKIQTGDMISIDGESGTVTIVETAKA